MLSEKDLDLVTGGTLTAEEEEYIAKWAGLYRNSLYYTQAQTVQSMQKLLEDEGFRKKCPNATLEDMEKVISRVFMPERFSF